MDKKEFGRHLHQLMVAKGMKQAELARQAGISRNSVCTYIQGRSFPSRDSLQKLASALGITADELLPGHEAMPVRGELKAEVELYALPNRPHMAFLSIRRVVPWARGVQILALLDDPQEGGLGKTVTDAPHAEPWQEAVSRWEIKTGLHASIFD